MFTYDASSFIQHQTENCKGMKWKMKKVRVKRPSLVLTHLIPDRVEIGLDGFRLLLVGVTSFRNQLDLDVGVAQSVRVHRDQVSGLNH